MERGSADFDEDTTPSIISAVALAASTLPAMLRARWGEELEGFPIPLPPDACVAMRPRGGNPRWPRRANTGVDKPRWELPSWDVPAACIRDLSEGTERSKGVTPIEAAISRSRPQCRREFNVFGRTYNSRQRTSWSRTGPFLPRGESVRANPNPKSSANTP